MSYSKDYAKSYYATHKEHITEVHKQYRADNKEKVAEIEKNYRVNHPQLRKEWSDEYYKKNKTKILEMNKPIRRARNLRAYGMTQLDYEKMYIAQDGCCAICGTHQNELNMTLSVDHDHKTDKVRGLLCTKCNAGIGNLNDNPELLLRAICYLERPR